MTMSDEFRLSQYKISLKSAWGYNDYNDWPIKFNSIMHIFLEQFASEFLSDLEEISRRGIGNDTIAKEFGNPARLYRIINPVIYGMKQMKIDINTQREIVIKMLNIVKYMKYGSEFNEDGVNLILSQEDVNLMNSNLDFKRVDANSASMVQRLCGIAWAYTEAIFFRAHDVTKEIHGPYRLPGYNGQLIVREYLNLRPSYIWGENIPFIPYENIKIYAKYKYSLKITIDSYNHLFLHGGNYVDDLEEYAIEADGESIEVSKLIEIIPEMLKTIEAVHMWSEASDWCNIANRYADIYWYRKSPLRSLLYTDWKVPKVVRENISKSNIDEKRLKNLSKESIDRLIRISI